MTTGVYAAAADWGAGGAEMMPCPSCRADGHIAIWQHKKVVAAFPEADQLFQLISSHYKDELLGVEYDHVYWGDNLSDLWSDPGDSYLCLHPEIPAERFEAFLAWLQGHFDAEWEVWT